MSMKKYLPAIILIFMMAVYGCSGTGNTVVPPEQSDLIRVGVTRLFPDDPEIKSVVFSIFRSTNGTFGLPGRNLVAEASSGDASTVTDKGGGNYEAMWTGTASGEITVLIKDMDSDPPVETGFTFLAMEYLDTEWDVPVKIPNPVSSPGWEASPFIYPDGRKIAFSYITMDMASLSAGIERSIGDERPGQSIPKTFDIYLAGLKSGSQNLLDWNITHPDGNLFQSAPVNMSAPSVTSDLSTGFCTLQFQDGDSFTPSAIFITDPEFDQTPSEAGKPVDMDGFGEDNPYMDVTSGYLFFDVYDTSDPLSKQDIWVAQSFGGGTFDTPHEIQGGLNTGDIEAQPFIHEPQSEIYFASDRENDEFILSIWKASIFGDQAGFPELVAKGMLGVGNPSITYDGKLLCFAYAREESGGVNEDIAISRRLE
jgi:hypothetical protein